MMNTPTTPRIVQELVVFFRQFPDCSITALSARAGVSKNAISMLLRREQADIRSADADALRYAMAEFYLEQDNKKS